MKRCRSDKDRCQQLRCHIGVQLGSGCDKVFQRMALLNGDERAGLVIAQQHCGCNDLINEVLLLIAGKGRDPGKHIRFTQTFQNRPYLRLEDDNDREESPVDKDVRDIGHRFETHHGRKGIDKQNEQNSLKDLHRLRVRLNKTDRVI